ncbi:hypothetical protein [Gabonibacter chumensis]|uniref:hypothetical protein n=1 Tax=Gabonibacter chumensis TaxID=2972474 RepID=UPI0025737CBC|nr:hypothetical protein [Gabonibacter chumensis]MCR9011875.1 hypothetical protein [Gabonibacter chumensis]
MKIRLLFWCCVLILFWSCSDDDSGTMHELTNWFEIQDNPNDELQHLAYLIYKDTGIPIFYNDTIGCEQRGVNADGTPYYYYEILDGRYTLSGTANLTYKISPNRNKIKLGLELLRDQVIRRLPKRVRVNSFLLVDTIYLNDNRKKIELNVYRSMMTTLVGKIICIDKMTDQDKDIWAAEILSTSVAAYMINNTGNELDEFYAVIRSIPSGNEPPDPTFANYGMFIYTMGEPEPSHEDFGCLSSVPTGSYGFTLPKREKDLNDYIMAYYSWKESDFLEKYKNYPKVLEKYQWLRNYMDREFK